MSKLSAAQQQSLKKSLEERKEKLLQELDEVQLGHLEKFEEAGTVQHDSFTSQANRNAQNEVRDAEARRDHDELLAVRNTLQRMEEGKYGDCLDCSEEIPIARLEAFPAALRCLRCQDALERDMKKS